MISALKKRLLSVADYHKMAAIGILPDRGIELIDGEIIEMSPTGSRHLSCVNTLNEILIEALRRSVIISIQNPISLGPFSEPEPDIVILKRKPSKYADALPEAEDVLLLIEVADSSVAYDREVKMKLYAQHLIPEYWLVDLSESRLEVYTDPVDDYYRTRSFFKKGESVVAQLVPLKLPISDFL